MLDQYSANERLGQPGPKCLSVHIGISRNLQHMGQTSNAACLLDKILLSFSDQVLSGNLLSLERVFSIESTGSLLPTFSTHSQFWLVLVSRGKAHRAERLKAKKIQHSVPRQMTAQLIGMT